MTSITLFLSGTDTLISSNNHTRPLGLNSSSPHGIAGMRCRFGSPAGTIPLWGIGSWPRIGSVPPVRLNISSHIRFYARSNWFFHHVYLRVGMLNHNKGKLCLNVKPKDGGGLFLNLITGNYNSIFMQRQVDFKPVVRFYGQWIGAMRRSGQRPAPGLLLKESHVWTICIKQPICRQLS